MDYEVEAISISTLSPGELDVCCQIIKKGCAVDPQSARAEIPKATALVIARMGKEIAGVGVIKRRRLQYARRISRTVGLLSIPVSLKLVMLPLTGSTVESTLALASFKDC